MDYKEEAWNEFVTRLNSITGIKKVYEQYKKIDSISIANCPYIMLEPDIADIIEDSQDVEGISLSYDDFRVVLWFVFTMFKKDSAVSGSAEKQGILYWEKKIKDKVFASPRHLNNTVQRVSFGRVLYLRSSTETASTEVVRILQMEVSLKILYSR